MTAAPARVAAGAPAPGTGAEPVRAGSRWGHWNSAVTSYYVIIGATALLLILGLVMVLSSSSVESIAAGRSPYAVFVDQARYAIMALPVAWVASRLPSRLYQRWAWPVLGLAAVLQLLVFVPGIGFGAHGNRNWIHLAGLTAQPSEAIKLALALWLGAVLSRKASLLGDWGHVLVPVVPVSGLMIGLVLLGHDLGTALVMMVLVVGALFVAGVPMRMLTGLAAMAGLVAGGLALTSDSRLSRIMSWFGAGCDVLNECYQTVHGVQALATGGWAGLGLGQSREKWSYLPEAHNDFIFAIIGEELGLVGTLLVLALFALLALAMLRVMRRHPDPFVRVTTGAVLCWVIGQAMVNVAVVIGLLPVIGVPLPLVSAGGSALVTTLVAIGVVVSFARSEPGAREALAARPGVVRRSLAVIGASRA